MNRRLISIAVSLVIAATALAVYLGLGGDRAPQLKVLKTIVLGGEGKWDYLCVDAEGRRLYLPRSTTLQVVDLDNGAVVETISGASRSCAHGVALAPEHKLGFVTSGKDRCVFVFDIATLSITNTVKTGGTPDCITYDPASKHLFCNHSDGITVIDPAALDKTVSISVAGRLEASVPDGAGHLFVCVLDTDEIAQIDTLENKVLARWPLGTGKSPTGLAIDKERMRLYVGCGNHAMVILDANTGNILDTTPIGRGVDGVAFDPSLRLAVSADGADGTLSVIREAAAGKFKTIDVVKTMKGARTITVDPKTHQFLLPCNLPDGNGGETFGVVVVGVEK